MITKTKTYNVLEVDDVERIISEFVGRDVKIGEMEVELNDCIPYDSTMEDSYDLSDFCMIISVIVDDEELLDDEYDSPLQKYLPKGVFVPEKYIFNFDTKLFKSYSRCVDTSD